MEKQFNPPPPSVFHDFESNSGLSYPVGYNMDAAIKNAIAASKLFNDLYPFYIRSYTRINVWCRGSSGAILATLFLAHITGGSLGNIVHVKKPGENAHSFSTPSDNAINVVIDDFIQSGDTMRAILAYMTNVQKIDCLILAGGATTQGELEFIFENKIPTNIIQHKYMS